MDMSPNQMTAWTVYVIILVSMSQLLMLALVLILAYKLGKLVNRLDEVSRDAGKFVRLGMHFFKGQRNP